MQPFVPSRHSTSIPRSHWAVALHYDEVVIVIGLFIIHPGLYFYNELSMS